MPVQNNYVTAFELLLPPLSAGLLLGGLLLFAYLAFRYRSRLYVAIALFALSALFFVVCDSVIALWGSWLGDTRAGLQAHRLEQIVGAYFLFALPFLLVQMLKLDGRWKRLNLAIALAGLGLAVAFTVVAFAAPGLYIAMDERAYSELPGRITYLWGREGALYPARDVLVGIVILYSLVCIVVDMIRHRRRDLVLFLLGILAAVAGAALDMSAVWNGGRYLGPFPDQNFTRFSVGLTLLALALMAGVVWEYVRLAQEVHRATERIKLSERKNRILAQGTKDCILSLNDDYFFLNANKQAFRELPLREDALGKTNFFDLVATGAGSAPFLVNVLKQRLAALKERKESFSMKLRLKCFLPTETRSYNVSFEYVDTEEGNEIIATASLPEEETHLKYVQAESGKYVIDNYLLTVEDVCGRLVAALPKFAPAEAVKQVQFGLREMLINALEHGNLEIASDEKNLALMEDRYFQFLSERQNRPPCRDRKITVEYSVSQAKAVYRITDQGKGFDTRAFLAEVQSAKENLNLQGRGILMALQTFDKISYNDAGNSVTLVKNLG